MKHLKLFESFGKEFDPYQEISEEEYQAWLENHDLAYFEKKDTLTVLEVIDNLWIKKASTIEFWNCGSFKDIETKGAKRVPTPVKNFFIEDRIWDSNEDLFKSVPYNIIKVFDDYHYLEVTKFEDEWYVVYYDTYGGGHSRYFLVDSDSGIDWLQDKISTIYSDVYENGLDESVLEDTLFEDLSDLFMMEMADWDSKEIENDSIELKRVINQYSDRDFIWRFRPTCISRAEFRICLDIQYNIELWGNSYGKTGAKLVSDIYKFTKQAARRYALKVFPKSKDMSDYQTFITNIQHFNTIGELRVYLGFEDPEKQAVKKTNESFDERNMPQRFEADDENLAIIKRSNFKDTHPQIPLTKSQIDQITKLLDIREFNWKIENGYKGDAPDYLVITYKKMVEYKNKIYPFRPSSYDWEKFDVTISAHEDEWFLIDQVSHKYGHVDMYLADQFEQVINFIKSLTED